MGILEHILGHILGYKLRHKWDIRAHTGAHIRTHTGIPSESGGEGGASPEESKPLELESVTSPWD